MKRQDFIYRLPLGTKERNALRQLGVDTIDQLLELDACRVRHLSGYGQRTEARIHALQQLAAQAIEADTSSAGAVPSDATVKINDIELGSRERRVLELFDVVTVRDLRDFDPYQVTQVRGIGHTTLKNIVALQKTVRKRGAAFLPRRPTRPSAAPDATSVPPPDYSGLRPLLESLLRACVPNERNREIYRRRLGLDLEARLKRPVLQELADQYGVTRERIRQICQETEVRLRRRDAIQYLSRFWAAVNRLLDAHNGFHFIDALHALLQTEFGWHDDSPQMLAILLGFHADLKLDADMQTVARPNSRCLNCTDAQQFVGSILGTTEGRDDLSLDDVGKSLASYCRRRCVLASPPSQPFHPLFIRHLAAAVPQVDVVDSRLVTHDRWLRDRSRKVRELAALVLQDAGEPMHFRAITNAIRSRFPRMSNINDNRVHGTLVRCDEFSCTSRGTYGLTKWGLKKYKSHGRAVIQLLQETGHPMNAQEIIRTLTQDPDLNAVSIRAALHNHTRVKRVARATYALADAEDTAVTPSDA